MEHWSWVKLILEDSYIDTKEIIQRVKLLELLFRFLIIGTTCHCISLLILNNIIKNRIFVVQHKPTANALTKVLTQSVPLYKKAISNPFLGLKHITGNKKNNNNNNKQTNKQTKKETTTNLVVRLW